MAKFLIEPHFRLQEWVAEEKNYFRKEGIYQWHRYAKQVQETFGFGRGMLRR